MFLFKGDNVGFLSMKVDGLAHPGLEGVRDFLQGVDHGGNLDV